MNLAQKPAVVEDVVHINDEDRPCSVTLALMINISMILVMTISGFDHFSKLGVTK